MKTFFYLISSFILLAITSPFASSQGRINNRDPHIEREGTVQQHDTLRASRLVGMPPHLRRPEHFRRDFINDTVPQEVGFDERYKREKPRNRFERFFDPPGANEHAQPYRQAREKPKISIPENSSSAQSISSPDSVVQAWVGHYASGLVPSVDDAVAIAIDSRDSSIIVTGSSSKTFTGYDYFTIKYTKNGDTVWTARYDGGGMSDFVAGLAIDDLGNVYVIGTSDGSGTYDDYVIIKYNANGVQQWVKRYNGPENFYDEATAISVDQAGNVYVTGGSYGSSTDEDYATIKYNTDGVEQWAARYNGPGNIYDEATAISIDQAGNVYVTGTSEGSGTSIDYATIKYNTDGVEQWAARYNGPGNSEDIANAISVDPLGNVYVTGWSWDSGTDEDYATIKYNPNGVQQWVKRYNGPGNSYDEATALSVDPLGNVYVTGYSSGSGSSYDYATIKYNSNGVQQWVKRYNGPGNLGDVARAISVDLIGNVYVTGGSEGSGTSYDYATIKYNYNGVEQWVARYNGPGNSSEGARAISVDQAGNVYVTGWSDIPDNYDYVTIKYNTNGVEQWVSRYDGPGKSDDNARAISVDPLGNVYVTGYSYGSGTSYDYVTIKYNSNGVEQWAARYNGTGDSYDFACAISVDHVGNVYVTGTSYGLSTSYDYATIKYNADGVQQWVARYDGPGNDDDWATAISVDPLGNVYVTGSSDDNYSYATIMYNSNGMQQWAATYRSGEASAISIDPLGNVYITGYNSRGDYATIKYNSDGIEQWVATYNGPGNERDRATAIAVDALGNVYVTGSSYGSGLSYNYATIKYNANGVEQWVARYSGPGGYDWACALSVDPFGNVFVTGSSYGSGTNSDYATIMYNSNGVEQWVARYDVPGNLYDYATALSVDQAGNVFVTGYSSVGRSNVEDYATIKYNYDGVEQWVARYGEPWTFENRASALSVDLLGNVYVIGTSYYGGGGFCFTTIKYEQILPNFRKSISEILFEEVQVGCRRADSFYIKNDGVGILNISSIIISDPNFTIVPQKGAINPSDSLWFKVTFTPLSEGEKNSIIVFHHNALSSPDTIVVSGTGTLEGIDTIMTQNYGTGWQLISVPLTVVCPYLLDNSFEYKGSYVMRDTLENGSGYWNKLTTTELLFAGSPIEIDTVSVNEGWNMIGSISVPVQTSSIISDPPGITTSNFFGYSSSYIISDMIYPGNGYWVKVKQPGLLILSSTPPLQTFARIRIVPTSELPPSPPGENKEIAEIPKEFSLCEAYPNPFNPSTVIRYSLPVNSWVTLKIYNLLGQEVATLIDEFQDAGYKSIEWDASRMASGMYFFRIIAENYNKTKKMLLLR